ncbi:MAG: ABC transporter permease [Patescibacteria group bacterium]
MNILPKFLETIKLALKSVSSNKVRSFLTMLGVIIGVASVILLISIGNGITGYVTGEFEKLGSNLVLATPGKIKVEIGGGDPSHALTNSKFSETEVKNVERITETVIAATIEATDSKRANYKKNTFYSLIYATDYNFPKVLNYKVLSGRFFTKAEYQNASRSAIIGNSVVEKLFKNENPLGKEFTIEDKKFTVIGVYEKRGGFGGQDYDSIITIPFTTAKLLFNIRKITGINIKTNPAVDINQAKKDIEKAFLKTLTRDDFTLFTAEELLSSINNILTTLTTALAGIAAISLLVGGIGIMNIMLVSVTERTREIGLRKAVGATPNNILVQFLTESLILSVIGGFNGILLGYLGSLALKNFIPATLTPGSVLLAFAFSAGVGIIFGTYPAYKAAKKNPIDALRYE